MSTLKSDKNVRRKWLKNYIEDININIENKEKEVKKIKQKVFNFKEIAKITRREENYRKIKN